MINENESLSPADIKVELLSPAGNFEKLKMAVLYGADAVYMSGKHFGLRAFSENFKDDELRDGIEYAHQHGVKAYVTMNILAHPDDFDGMEDYIAYLVSCNADALIISDPGIFSLVRRIAPQMDIHISTQASVTNAQGCLFWHEAGARRIVLARELTLGEIVSIRKEIPQSLELEVFVHGAMCVSYSGRCLLSNYFTGRDGNRGKCAQPCRWNYELTEAKHQDQPVEMQQDGKGTYLFSSKDLCMIEHIPELINAGIHSFKIEGRIKGAFYAATVTKAYREAIDEYYRDPVNYKTDPALLADLEKTVHREFDTGFYFGGPMENAQINDRESYIKEAAVVGIIKSYDPITRRAVIEQRNKIFDGELLEVVSPRGRHCDIIARDLKDIDEQPLESTPHPKMIYSMPMRVPVDPNSFIRRLGARD